MSARPCGMTFLLCMFVLFGGVAAKVHDLSHSSFADFIHEHDTVLVNFGSPWCGHCKVLEPHFKQASEFLEDHNIKLAKVDCVSSTLDWTPDSRSLCDDINAYPTLRVYHGNPAAYSTYDGRRKTADDIISYMTNGTYPTHTDQLPTSTHKIEYWPPSKTPPPNPDPYATASSAVLVADNQLSAVVKLKIPGLPFLDDEKSSSVLLNLSVSANGQHLLVNGNMLAMRVPDPSRPPSILAPQVLVNSSIVDHSRLPKSNFVGLDYELWSNNRDDPSITYYNYYPKIYLNLIGAGVELSGQSPTDLLLDAPEQRVVEITLHDAQSRPSNSRELSYEIVNVKLLDRAHDYRAPRPDDRLCSGWSWRCADIADPPWYQYVWRQNFDEYGRIGCMRRGFLIRWHRICRRLSRVPWLAWLVLASGMIIKLCLVWRKRRLSQTWRGEPDIEKQAKV